MTPLRILLADDHEVVLEGLRRILDRAGFEVVGAVKDGRSLVELTLQLQPDIVVADVSMPSLNGVDAARQMQKLGLETKIVFLSMHPEHIYAVEAINAGGVGYVLKDSAGVELVRAIEEVWRGHLYIAPSIAGAVTRALENQRKHSSTAVPQLTGRQREVLQLLAEGRNPKEIAGVLHVSARTVEFHKYRVMEALGLRTVAELAAYAVKNGMVA